MEMPHAHNLGKYKRNDKFDVPISVIIVEIQIIQLRVINAVLDDFTVENKVSFIHAATQTIFWSFFL